MKNSHLPEKLYYSIREVADYFEVAPSLLRFWEKQFTHVNPRRNEKGTRFYTAKNIEDLSIIYQLVKEKGYTLQGARDVLKLKKGAENTIVDKLLEIKERLTLLKNQLHE